jgi:hypothetical protein
MSHEPTGPVPRRGWPWPVTGDGIEALDGMTHVPFCDLPDAPSDRDG